LAVLLTRTEGEVFVVEFTDAQILDENKISQINDELIAALDKCPSDKLLLNFKNVKFMSSSVLGRLVHLSKKCKAEKIQLKLCNISPDIMEVFRITRLNKIFTICDSEADAIDEFAKSGWKFG